MTKHLPGLLFIFISFIGRATGLSADTTVSTDKLLGGTFANDATFRTDYYFTQGGTVNFIHPALQKSPVRKILFRGNPTEKHYYGLKISYDGFTPLRISDPNIRYGDRPYASYIYTYQYKIQNNYQVKSRLTSGLILGIIGPITGANGFQSKLHEWLSAPIPQGWRYQVQNDLLLGYEVAYEKQLLSWPQHLEVIGQTKAALSSLFTYAEGGLFVRTGKLNSYFENLGIAAPANRAHLQQFQYYGIGSLKGRLVGYNATLQGGLFNKKDPYTLNARSIKRAVGQRTAGLGSTYKGFSLETSVVWISREFVNARRHKWMYFEIKFVI